MLLPVPATGMHVCHRQHEVVRLSGALEELLGAQTPHASPKHCDQHDEDDVKKAAKKGQGCLAGPLGGKRRRPLW